MKQERSGFIIVRIAGAVRPAEADTLMEFAGIRQLRGIEEVLRRLRLPSAKRAIRSMPLDTILRLESRAAGTTWRPAHSLASYWRIDARDFRPEVRQVLEQLNGLAEVDLAYEEPAAFNTGEVEPVDDRFFSRQGYLKPAPEGIDAPSVWAMNARGEGVAFIDVERGWFLGHENLGLPESTPVLCGDNFTADADHGLAVLGIVLGKGNGRGMMGIASGASPVVLASRYRAAERSEAEVANAICQAITHRQPGDVLLLEVQRGSPNRPMPAEIEDLDFDAIRLAVSQGIVVIEAAGNGNADLDMVRNKQGTRSLDLHSHLFRDSGAIMVGSCNKEVLEGGLHSRYRNSNYGSRLDCYAWGEGIVTTTTSYGELGTGLTPASRYTGLFGGTSGASAIIAGAALLLQSLYQAKRGERLLPNADDPLKNMRAILSDAATGTGQRLLPGRDGPIGVMPDLRKIIHKLGLAIA